MGLMIKYLKTAVSSAGSLVFTTDVLRGKNERVIVKPPTEQTTYNLKFTDDNGLDVYVVTGITGTYRDLSPQPLKGAYIVTLSSISVDGTFIVQIELEERA